ncbi:hypothetical protein PATA110616_16275 [Paenibacillus tarimensis]
MVRESIQLRHAKSGIWVIRWRAAGLLHSLSMLDHHLQLLQITAGQLLHNLFRNQMLVIHPVQLQTAAFHHTVNLQNRLPLKLGACFPPRRHLGHGEWTLPQVIVKLSEIIEAYLRLKPERYLLPKLGRG